MKEILQNFLAFLARMILKKYKPRIGGITGSVGKSSTKEAIVEVLGEKFHVRGSPKNYNNELGVPLTIIGALSGGRSLWRWLLVLGRAGRLILGRGSYPAILVLEMGADHPGDLAYLTRLAPPEVGVVTAIAVVHTEFLRDVRGVEAEKSTLVTVLPHTGFAVLNGDDEMTRGFMGKTRARVITYGFGEHNDLRAIEFTLQYEMGGEGRKAGVLFKIASSGSVVPVKIDGVLGRQHVYAALAGAAVGVAFGLNLVEIANGLTDYEPPRGRMSILPGIKGTTLIDDTYNASPRATHEALETIRAVNLPENGRRIAVLGEMKELGAYAEAGHEEVGRRAAEIGIDSLVTVGELARDIARGAREAGLAADRIYEFMDLGEAGRFVQDRLRTGDVVLIKGSQAARMEFIVKELMAEPLRAKELLVRQDSEWI